MPILEIENLQVSFNTIDGVVPAVTGVDLRIERGETVGLVGESGSGKSVTAMSAMRLLAEPPASISGAIRFQRRSDEIVDIVALPHGSPVLQDLRGNEIAMVFQEPMRAMSPVFTVGHQVAEAIWLHRDISKEEAHKEAVVMLDRVGIPDPDRRATEYPHQLSGGQRQRVMIAMALSCRPSLLIADEPTTALDVTIQAQILDLLKELQDEFNLAVLLITHDLGIVAGTCSRVAVMYMGEIVEEGSVFDIFENPTHPYTQGLLKSVPVLGEGHMERLPAIRGTVPDHRDLPTGCAFGPRCDHFELGTCDVVGRVGFVSTGENQRARCYRTDVATASNEATEA
jgi:oligopeptide/dipeptide ABC transporter ATP-binding protein